MVEDVESVGAELQRDSLWGDVEGLTESHIHVKVTRAAKIVPRADLESDRTGEVRIRLGRAGEGVQRLAVTAVDVGLHIGRWSDQNARCIVGESGNKCVGWAK